MDYNAILERILNTVDREAYRFSGSHLSQPDAAAQKKVHEALANPSIDLDLIQRMVDQFHANGEIDEISRLSLLFVIAAHPRAKDYARAGRLLGERETAVWERAERGNNDAEIERLLAAVDRHRGALAFLMGRYAHALDHFARALERERIADNLQNVLATLLRLGEEDDARELLGQVRQSYPAPVVEHLDRVIQEDPDLALLRQENTP
jgi:tetratricopeptide (TPR) repeat protein